MPGDEATAGKELLNCRKYTCIACESHYSIVEIVLLMECANLNAWKGGNFACNFIVMEIFLTDIFHYNIYFLLA